MSDKCQVPEVCAQKNARHAPTFRPDSLWSWLVCAAGLASVVIVAGVGYSFGLLLPTLMEHFQATRQQTGKKTMDLQLLQWLNKYRHTDTLKVVKTAAYPSITIPAPSPAFPFSNSTNGLLVKPCWVFHIIFLSLVLIAAWIGTLYFGFGCILSPFGSYTSQNFGYRFTAMLGSSAGIIGFFLASFSSQLWIMYITYGCLSGLGHMLILNSCYLVILPYFVKWRSLAVGIVASGPAIGMFVITQLSQVMSTEFGWKWTVRGFAVLYFICGVCATVFMSFENPREERLNNKSIPEERSVSSLFRNRSFVILLTSLTVVNFAYYVPTVHIVSNRLIYYTFWIKHLTW